MRLVVRFFAKFSVLIGIVLIVAYAAAPTLIETLLKRQLEAKGFENISVQAQRPKWNTLQLNWLSMVYRQSAVKWSLESLNAAVELNIAEWFVGDLPDVIMESAFIEIDSRGHKLYSDKSHFDLPYPVDLIGVIPLQSVDIKNIQLRWQNKQRSLEYEGAFLMQQLADRAKAHLTIATSEDKDQVYDISMQLTRSGQLSASLTSSDTPDQAIIDIKSRLSRGNQSIRISKAHATFYVSAFGDMVESLRLSDATDFDFSGRVQLDFQGHIHSQFVSGLPKQYRLYGAVESEISTIDMDIYPDISEGIIEVNFDIDHVSTAFSVSDQTKLKILPSKAWFDFIPALTTETLTLSVTETLRYQSDAKLSDVLQAPQWLFQGELLLQQSQDSDHAWQCRLRNPLLNSSDLLEFNASLSLNATIDAIAKENFSSKLTEVNINGMLLLREDQFKIAIDQQSAVSGEKWNIAGALIDKLDINVAAPFDVFYRPEDKRLSINGAAFAFQSDDIMLNSFTLSQTDTILKIEEALSLDNEWSLQGVLLHKADLGKTHQKSWLPISIASDFQANSKEITGNNDYFINDGDQPFSKGEFSYSWQEDKGGLNISSQASPVSSWTALLPLLFDGFNEKNFSLTEGALDMNVSLLRLDSETKGKASLRLTGITGRYRDTNFQGLNTLLVVDDVFDSHDEITQRASIARVAAAVELDNISFQYQLSPLGAKTLVSKIANLSAQTLGGELQLKNHSLQSDSSASTELIFKGVQLAKVLEIDPRATLTGNGELDGSLYISKTSYGEIIVSGELRSRQPGGVIQYIGEDFDALAQSEPELHAALNPQQEFQYSELGLEITQEKSKPQWWVSLTGRSAEFPNQAPLSMKFKIEKRRNALLNGMQAAGG